MTENPKPGEQPTAEVQRADAEQLLEELAKRLEELQQHVLNGRPLKLRVPIEVEFDYFARHPVTGEVKRVEVIRGTKAITSASTAGDGGEGGDGGG